MSTDTIKYTSEFIPDDNSINKIIYSGNNNKPKPIPFWSENPNILFQSEYITEFFPVKGMPLSQSLNAITRSIIILSIIGFLLTKNWSFSVALVITMVAIYFYYQAQQQNKHISEGYANPGLAIMGDSSYNKNLNMLSGIDLSSGKYEKTTVFDDNTSSNPYSNVLLTDYDINPNKKPAPPAGNNHTYQNILTQAKKTVMEINHEQPDIAEKLFKDLGENLEFEQSMRNFYSNPATTIPNDQAAFAEFCYGSMISCKEGNAFACARNLDRYM
jgi:hypothetical protein